MPNSYSLKSYHLSEKAFCSLRDLIDAQIGIKMPEAKRVMLESRLQKRLRELQLESFEDYYKYLVSSPHKSSELIEMINVVTTNKTDFFREPEHFAFLSENILPSLFSKGDVSSRNPFRIWSAGCSSGEEPYTMGMVLEDFSRENPGFSYEIDATDISMKVLNQAKRGVYPAETIKGLPREIKKKYFLKGTDANEGKIKVKSFLQKKVTFRQLNLMGNDYPAGGRYHVVFCHNVLIYFERERQREIILKLVNTLKAGGYLFLGHSESTTGMILPVEPCRTAVYRKPGRDF